MSYGNETLDYILNNKMYGIMENILKYDMNSDIRSLKSIFVVNSKLQYTDNYNKFLCIIGKNIHKINKNNAEKVYQLFLQTHVNLFTGFNQWGPGNHKNSSENVIKHYIKHVQNSTDENWTEYISPLCINNYRDFAINKSRVMKQRMVHTNGSSVYLSGLYEKILIIGRLDKNNILGISSCYIINDEKYENKIKNFINNICFVL